MPGWLWPVAASLLSVGGTIAANRANRKEAQENREFQERMSSTAAQRAVEDYRAAGLNPALAYDRGASSPGGAVATLGDPINAGLSTARDTARMQQEMRIAREQHYENLRATRAQADKATADAAASRAASLVSEGQSLLQRQMFDFNQKVQPADARIRNAEALLREYELPGARNTAAFEELMGRARPGLNSARTAAEILKLLNPRGFRR